MREWKYRHESEEKCSGGKYGSGNIGTVLQEWKIRESRLWLVEQGLTSHSTQFRSFRRRCFYRSDDPTNSVKALKEGG